MRKYNKRAMEMFQKYGAGWDAPLFHHSAPSPKVEPASPQVPPLFKNDATEDKAMVFESLSTEEQRKRVLEAFTKMQPATDNDVARFLKIVPSTVSARRNNNIDLGLMVPVLDEHGRKVKKIDPITKVPNVLWRVK